MTLLEALNKGQYITFLKILLSGGFITTTASGESAGLTVVDSVGKKGQAHDRERVSVTTVREKVHYTESQGVTEVTVEVFDTAIDVTDSNAALAICFDAFDDAEADGWLTETDLESFDVQRKLVQVGKEKTFYFSQPLANAHFKAIGAETLRVFIGGV